MNETSSVISKTVLPPIKIGGWIRHARLCSALMEISGEKYLTLSFPDPPTLVLSLALSLKWLTLSLLSHELMS